MALLHIREHAGLGDGANAELSFEHTETYPITISDPFAEADEQRLEWYFEGWLIMPFANTVEAQAVAASTVRYGETLFRQVFADPRAYARYKQFDLNTLRIDYPIVHFDVHGTLLSYEELQAGIESNRLLYQARYGRADIAPYEGVKGFLFLEGEQPGQADPVEAGELAQRLIDYRIPVVILNACQSGKQVCASETSLGSRLMQAGAQLVLAMGYLITVSAADLLM